MLTPEQIKNLKKGDPIVIRTTFNRAATYGDIWFRAPSCLGGSLECYIHPSAVFLPTDSQSSATAQLLRSGDGSTVTRQSKYAPCRLFKKGDRIRFKTWHGFQPEDWENEAELLGKEATVYEDQKPDDFSVHFLFDGEDPDEEWHATYLPFIELVTPVEELESFGVRYSKDRDCAEVYHRRYKNTVAAFYCKCGITREQAEEHAEAECDRLNAELRKEQNNDRA